MLSAGFLSPSATVICPFPGPPVPSTASLRVHTKYHMTAADLREVRNAVIGLPLPWFTTSEGLNTDTVAGYRWTSSLVDQVAGPTIANFAISKNGEDGYLVDMSQNYTAGAEWHGFPTAAAAVAAIWAYTTEVLTDWGLVAA